VGIKENAMIVKENSGNLACLIIRENFGDLGNLVAAIGNSLIRFEHPTRCCGILSKIKSTLVFLYIPQFLDGAASM
jgi:hypothetical protein